MDSLFRKLSLKLLRWAEIEPVFRDDEMGEGPVYDLWRLIEAADSVVALTGAGVSTEAGIPDFRSPGGLWCKYDPMEVFSTFGFRQKPEILYTVGRDLTRSLLTAEPTLTHFFLARLEQVGKLKTVVTQNVDGLHQKAGNTDVIELHGNMRNGHCLDCGMTQSIEEMEEQMEAGTLPPRCPACGGLVKPDVVLFGDPLPEADFQRAVGLASRADLFLALGTSLVVSPASELPTVCQQSGGRLAIINIQETWLDHSATLVLHEKLGPVMSELLRLSGAQ